MGKKLLFHSLNKFESCLHLLHSSLINLCRFSDLSFNLDIQVLLSRYLLFFFNSLIDDFAFCVIALYLCPFLYLLNLYKLVSFDYLFEVSQSALHNIVVSWILRRRYSFRNPTIIH